MRPRPAGPGADGSDHARHGRRGGHAPHHGGNALCHRRGHGGRRAPYLARLRRDGPRRAGRHGHAGGRLRRPTRCRRAAAAQDPQHRLADRPLRQTPGPEPRGGPRSAGGREAPAGHRRLGRRPRGPGAAAGGRAGGFPRGHRAGAARGRVVRRGHGRLAQRSGGAAGQAGARRRIARTRPDIAGRHRRPSAPAGRWYAAVCPGSQGKPVPAFHRCFFP
ncbi:hypothetical protein FQZ97_609750 [compost metagenome]